MIVLVDADSLVYACAWGKEDLEDAKDCFDMHMHNIYAAVLDRFGHVEEFIVYHGTKGKNFRKEITPTYKANRTQPKPELYASLSNYVSFFYNALVAVGREVDDVIADDFRRHKRNGYRVCIAAIDKDFLQLPGALIYSWHGKRKGWTEVSEEEAVRNFYTQMIVGDTADNINYLKGKGVKFAEKHLDGAVGTFSHLRRVYSLFVEKYGQEAKYKFNECYALLKIGT